MSATSGQALNGALRLLFVALLGVVAALTGLYVLTETRWPMDGRFDLDAEANVPTWFSTLLLFAVGLTCFALHRVESSRARRPGAWRWFWLGLGVPFIFLSLDEGARGHELISQTTSIKWLFLYAPVCGAIFALCAVYFLTVRRGETPLLTPSRARRLREHEQ